MKLDDQDRRADAATAGAQDDLWVDGGVIWAVARGPLLESASKDLMRRAIALAAETANWRFMFDYRHSTLTHDVLALNRHAELMYRLGLPESTRMAMLCRHRSADFLFWERVLSLRGLSAGTFTDGAAAIVWLHKHQPHETEQPVATDAAKPRIEVDAVKRQLRQFAAERTGAPRSVVTAELTELVDCLFAQAAQLGVDLLQSTEASGPRNQPPSIT